ncbi:hypothetical protein N9A94_09670, partial [Akkermansiaceae bacterium]|nr:hypothetical protein [Akkermansiaceae bacterium]
MKTKTIALTSAALLVSFTAITAETHSSNATQPTAETQKLLTPDSVLKDLMAANEQFVKAHSADPNIEVRREIGTKGQNPKAFILSCIDSRVPVEQVFNQGLGDLFVGRVAGNIETTEQLG